MAARRKQQAVDVPATRAEADALVREYALAEHKAGAVRGFADVQIAKSKADRDAILAMIETEQSAIFARLKAWWEATGKDEAGLRRSLDIDGTQIGLRLTTPKLGFVGKLKEFDALTILRRMGWRQFIRTKEDVDKAAIIRAFGVSEPNEREAAELDVLAETFTVTQKDEFYIAVAPLEKTLTQGEVK